MVQEYNGWKGGYPTWSVALFILNESNECIREATRAALRDPYGDHLKEYVEEYFTVDPQTEEVAGGNLFIQQMLGWAMSEVDWQEVRDHLVDDYEEEACGRPACPYCGSTDVNNDDSNDVFHCHECGEYFPADETVDIS